MPPFYRDILAAAAEVYPSSTVEAVTARSCAFEMPGAGIVGFRRKAAAIALAGIFDTRIHYDEVVMPLVRKLPHLRAGGPDPGRRSGANRARRLPGDPRKVRQAAGRAPRPQPGGVPAAGGCLASLGRFRRSSPGGGTRHATSAAPMAPPVVPVSSNGYPVTSSAPGELSMNRLSSSRDGVMPRSRTPAPSVPHATAARPALGQEREIPADSPFTKWLMRPTNPPCRTGSA